MDVSDQQQTTQPDTQPNLNKEDDKSSECMDTMSKPARQTVNIDLCGSTPLLWKVSDIKQCREEVGVIGALVGSLARQPRQNVRMGRPLEILQEEAQLLLQTGRATATVHTPVSESKESHSKAVEMYQAISERSYKEQCALALQDKKAVLHRVMQEKQKDHSSNEEQAVRERLESLEKNFSFPRSAMLVQLCTARAGYSHCPEEREFLAADGSMPKDERLQTRFLVYRDLRRKGFYLTSAGKFGGDYLVYPGDPLRYHAHFIALCLSMDEQSPLYDILTIARLGSNVKKTVLLCSPHEPGDSGEDSQVVYSSLQWSGMM
ncbi:tRNA-splicing endonuclease subunit Sen34 [Trichomycterus rosablanca]|uniref:tRNA-splicing endonuclease subunit Sen34 n=1 Tax=Trichomycterus rosablanca TaxID=2290929 RepID=UPI002F35E2D9